MFPRLDRCDSLVLACPLTNPAAWKVFFKFKTLSGMFLIIKTQLSSSLSSYYRYCSLEMLSTNHGQNCAALSENPT